MIFIFNLASRGKTPPVKFKIVPIVKPLTPQPPNIRENTREDSIQNQNPLYLVKSEKSLVMPKPDVIHSEKSKPDISQTGNNSDKLIHFFFY